MPLGTLTYTATILQADGVQVTFSGTQTITGNPPQQSDVLTALSLMSTDLNAQASGHYAAYTGGDSIDASQGGHG